MNILALRFRTAAKLALILLLGFGAFGTPAQAQNMRQDGIPLPWFHTRAEKMARQACIDELPECRDSIREKLVVEQVITLLTPWVLLALVLLAGSMFMRYRERMREKHRHEAQRHHVQAAANRPRREEPRDRKARRDEPEPEADDVGLGSSGDR